MALHQQRRYDRVLHRFVLIVPFWLAGCLTAHAGDNGIILNDHNWPQFRGPQGSGLAVTAPPVEWNADEGTNIKWEIDVPGIGHSSPVVWGDQIFLTTAIDVENDRPTVETGWLGGTGDPAEDGDDWIWQVRSYSLQTGDLLWKNDVAEGKPTIQRHLKATHANCSVATNGEFVVAFFGSEGLHCFSMTGDPIWNTDFGKLHSGPYDAEELEWGFASSPVIFDSYVVVQCDCLNTCFVAIIDLATGDEIRRIVREDVATWSTPLVVRANDRIQIVCNGFHEMASYDLESGERLWFISGGGDVPVPTPIFADEKFILTNSHGRSPCYAIHANASGELEPLNEVDSFEEDFDVGTDPLLDVPSLDGQRNDGLAWYDPRDGSYMPTPIAIDDLLYTGNDNGRLVVRELSTGDSVYRERIGDGANFSASAIGTPDRIYFFDEAGDCSVVKTGRDFEVIATNSIGAPVMATPAIAGDNLIVRTLGKLICISDSMEP